MKDFVRSQLKNTLAVMSGILEDEAIHSTLVDEAERIAEILKRGGKLMVAGNGGSAADAQHLAAEFVSRLTVDRPAMHAIALTTDSSILTAIGNDYGYEKVFQRQIQAIGQRGDFFLGISTSGKSPNILCALQECRTAGIRTLGLTGGTGGAMSELCDSVIVIPSRITQNIQEAHLALEHILCGIVERYYFGEERFAAM